MILTYIDIICVSTVYLRDTEVQIDISLLALVKLNLTEMINLNLYYLHLVYLRDIEI